MSIRTNEIAKLEAEIKLHRQTEEAHEAWLKDNSTPIELLCHSTWLLLDTIPEWAINNHYRIAPKPKLRPWKPEEARGKWVTRDGIEGLVTQVWKETNLVHLGGSRTFTLDELLEKFTQLDGSPCGVLE